jgi:hypothetical protein
MKEDLLQFIWENLLFNNSFLRTVEGEHIEIIKPGIIQTGQGPDLDNAVIRINEQTWAGTVEIHIRSSDWMVHGHHSDPHYENVVLHVVHEDDLPARTSGGRLVPTIELSDRICKDSQDMYEKLMKSRTWIPCAEQVKQVPRSLIAGSLTPLLDRRLARRSREIQEMLSAEDNDETEIFYRLLMRTFGLKENQEAFAMLARSLPLKLLRKYRDDQLRLEALLFGVAGFLQVNFVDEYAKGLQQSFGMLSRAHSLKPIPLAMWKFGRVRPGNFPSVRLALFASLIRKLDGDLTKLILEKDVRQLRKLLAVRASTEWDNRYTLNNLTKQSPKRIGRSMADLVTANAVVPFLFARGSIQSLPSDLRQAHSLLQQMPAPKDRIVRGWAALGVQCESMANAQSLTELKNQFCSDKKCLNCEVGVHLMKRSV